MRWRRRGRTHHPSDGNFTNLHDARVQLQGNPWYFSGFYCTWRSRQAKRFSYSLRVVVGSSFRGEKLPRNATSVRFCNSRVEFSRRQEWCQQRSLQTLHCVGHNNIADCNLGCIAIKLHLLLSPLRTRQKLGDRARYIHKKKSRATPPTGASRHQPRTLPACNVPQG